MTAPPPPTHPPRRVVLLQTQAEAAGAQEVSRLLAERLAARGHEVRQLFFYRKTAAFDGDPTATICSPTRPSVPVGVLRMLHCLYRHLRDFRPDAVITFQHYGNLIGGPIARLAGVPTVIGNHNGLQDLLARPVIVLDRLLGTLGLFDRLVTNSAETEAEYRDYPARYRRHLIRIDHGFQPKISPLSRAEARRLFRLPVDSPVIGCVARLAPKKHQDAVIRILPLRPAWHLALAGQGPEADSYRALAAELGCADRLHFVGELSPGGVGDFLAGLDAFAFPSITETFGLAAVEAAGAGIPVVSNDLPVMREVLGSDGEPAALFVDVDEPPAFAAAIDRVLAEPALREAIVAAGRRLGSRFPIDEMVAGYEALLDAGQGRKSVARPGEGQQHVVARASARPDSR